MSNAIDRLEELEGRATIGPFVVVETDDGHEIQMASALDHTKIGNEVQHIIKYDHGMLPSDGGKHAARQYGEAEGNINLLAALRNAAKPLLAVVRAADMVSYYVNVSASMRDDGSPVEEQRARQVKAYTDLRLALATLKETTL